MAKKVGQRISKMGYVCSMQCTYQKSSTEGEPVNQWQGPGQQAHLVWSYRRASVVQLSEKHKFNCLGWHISPAWVTFKTFSIFDTHEASHLASSVSIILPSILSSFSLPHFLFVLLFSLFHFLILLCTVLVYYRLCLMWRNPPLSSMLWFYTHTHNGTNNTSCLFQIPEYPFVLFSILIPVVLHAFCQVSVINTYLCLSITS